MVNTLTPQEQHMLKHEDLAPRVRKWVYFKKNINKLDCNILLDIVQNIMAIQVTADFYICVSKGQNNLFRIKIIQT